MEKQQQTSIDGKSLQVQIRVVAPAPDICFQAAPTLFLFFKRKQ